MQHRVERRTRLFRATWLTVVAAFALSCGASEPTLEAGTTAFCCCNGDYPGQYLKNSSRQVLLNQPPWEGFGFYLRFPSRAPRTVTITHHLPGVPDELGAGWRELGYEPTDALNGLTAKPVEVRGGRWFTVSTETGDPVGTYRFDIAIDGSHWRTVEFEVSHGGTLVTEPGKLPDCPTELVFETV
jgi:hypothetical protein